MHFGLDGLSLLMILLTGLLGVLAVTCSWREVQRHVGFFHLNLLWIIGGVVGVFLALDLFLFFFFWEMMLVPMYFLIALWGHNAPGGKGRIYAANKFFIFTQASGLLMLLSILGLVLVNYNSTGVMSFDYDVLRAANPRLVYVAVSGYGQTGARSRRPAFDNTAQAAGGMWSMNGYPGQPPVRVGVTIGDLSATLFAVVGTLAALRHAERTGEGQLVDVAQVDSILALTETASRTSERWRPARAVQTATESTSGTATPSQPGIAPPAATCERSAAHVATDAATPPRATRERREGRTRPSSQECSCRDCNPWDGVGPRPYREGTIEGRRPPCRTRHNGTQRCSGSRWARARSSRSSSASCSSSSRPASRSSGCCSSPTRCP